MDLVRSARGSRAPRRVAPRIILALAAALAVVAALAAPAPAQEGAAGTAPKSPEASPPAEPAPLILDEAALQSYFQASALEITEAGRVKLTYDFSTKDSNLLVDWLPKIADTKRRIRWSMGLEGTFSTVEDGLIIADEGTFLHRAKWEKDVELTLDYLSMSGHDKNDLLAAVYLWDQGKQIVASQVGEQCLRLAKNLAPKGKPIPAMPLGQLTGEERRSFGVRVRDGIVSALRGGSAVASSEGKPDFAKEIAAGQVGLAWRGRVNGFIFKITIEGKLNPEWVKKEIPKAIVERKEPPPTQ